MHVVAAMSKTTDDEDIDREVITAQIKMKNCQTSN